MVAFVLTPMVRLKEESVLLDLVECSRVMKEIGFLALCDLYVSPVCS
jgi:hypothetical protein